MSADNWAVCPKCIVEAQKTREKLINNVKKKYGSVTADEYEKLMDSALSIAKKTWT